jgi:Tol biopolymer transport system component
MKNRFIILILLCGTYATVRSEKINLNVYASRFDSIPIGVVDFKPKTGDFITIDQPWRIIANDFDLCCRFNVVPRPEFDSVAFSRAGIALYIDGEYTLDPSVVVFTCFVKDAITHELLFEKEYRGKPAELRKMSHKFCNELYEILFGDKGIFETSILFIDRKSVV